MENSNIEEFKSLISPLAIKERIPVTRETKVIIQQWRTEIKNIISGKSNKKLFIVGPCSIHNTVEALIYAEKLKKIADIVSDTILIVMRVYFEKPRTTVGWKGLINDPGLDGSFRVNDGMFGARKLLLDINNLGLPCGYEILDTITPQYIGDLISWGAIGARTSESQVHRQMVSGLSMPVGFKNGTGGSKKIARDGILSAKFKHCFMGVKDNGIATICKTLGNNDCHIILRGGKGESNYSEKDIAETHYLLGEYNINKTIMIDCSRDNSKKNFHNQPMVFYKILEYMRNDKSIIGGMIESNINEGKQTLLDKSGLKYGVSITDGCINIETTEEIFLKADVLLKSYNIL